jgi:heptosyltransferase-1
LRSQSNFRLLVVRLGAMGDLLHALPAITGLRIVHPEWQIDWVVEPRWRALLSALPGDDDGGLPELSPAQPLVNRIYTANVKEWGRKPLIARTISEIKTLRSQLRSGHYDAVLDFQGALRSAAIGRLARSRRVIGEAVPREWAARWLFDERIATRGVHVIEQDVEVAAAVAGDALTAVAPPLPIDPAAERWVNLLLAAAPNRPAALMNPGAGWGAKRWPVDRYAAVAQGLIDRGMRVFVNAGPGEEPLAEAIAAATGGAANPLTFTIVTCTIEQLIALTRRIRLIIAGDTGPLHLASALGRPVVGIYGPTDPSRNGPFGGSFRVLRSPDSRRDHARREAPEAGLLTIEPEDVLGAADELLGEDWPQ